MVKTNSKDISGATIQIHEGTELGRRDGIGAGSWVYPSYSGDSYARFHVYWVNNKYLFGCSFCYELERIYNLTISY
jgi:hypothetical protein